MAPDGCADDSDRYHADRRDGGRYRKYLRTGRPSEYSGKRRHRPSMRPFELQRRQSNREV